MLSNNTIEIIEMNATGSITSNTGLRRPSLSEIQDRINEPGIKAQGTKDVTNATSEPCTSRSFNKYVGNQVKITKNP